MLPTNTKEPEQTSPERRRALLLGVERLRGRSRRSMEELVRLVQAAGLQPIEVIIQQRASPHPATFIGKGKLRQIQDIVQAEDLEVVVFNTELSPRQAAALGDLLDCEVWDRTEIILAIFSRHAHTREGKLQVEVAQLEYLLPRLVGHGVDLSQIAGGHLAGGAIGVRGPGETKLEQDRRTVRTRMHRLKARLEKVRQHRQVERAERARSGLSLVGLVGYTNAGKSSLLNALAGQELVAAHDRLFETLDTTIRRVDLGERIEVLVSDTVGFIDNLPTHLVSAFRATLEEAEHADLLIEILDATDPLVAVQHETVEEILADLSVADKPRLIVLNKRDLVSPRRAARLSRRFPEAISLSALTGEGLDELREELRARLAGEFVALTLQLPYDQLQLLNIPSGQGQLLDSQYEYEYVQARVRVHPRLIQRLRPYVVAEP